MIIFLLLLGIVTALYNKFNVKKCQTYSKVIKRQFSKDGAKGPKWFDFSYDLILIDGNVWHLSKHIDISSKTAYLLNSKDTFVVRYCTDNPTNNVIIELEDTTFFGY